MKTPRLLVITSLVLVALLFTTGMVFAAVGTVNQGSNTNTQVLTEAIDSLIPSVYRTC